MNLIGKYHCHVSGDLAVSRAEEIAFAILTDITNRGGIGDEWDQIDGETQDEVLKSWVDIVECRLPHEE